MITDLTGASDVMFNIVSDFFTTPVKNFATQRYGERTDNRYLGTQVTNVITGSIASVINEEVNQVRDSKKTGLALPTFTQHAKNGLIAALVALNESIFENGKTNRFNLELNVVRNLFRIFVV